MAKIIELFNVVPCKGMFGIEHEVEGRNLREVQNEVWNTTHDGSLRGQYPEGCAEFVLRQPLDLQNAVKAVTNLDNFLRKNKAVYAFSFRTSTHVHMNVQQMEENHVCNLILTYYLLEAAIIGLCGSHRVNNRFCLQLSDADEIGYYLRDIFSHGIKQLKKYDEHDIRYAALNLAAIRKYGSIEFRAMQGTLDPVLMEAWLTLLLKIRNYATSKKDITEVFNEAVNLGFDSFVDKVFGPEYDFLKSRENRDSFDYSLSINIDFPHLYKLYNPNRKVKNA